jgi:predicted DNA-binding protein (UPF0251 family)
MARHSKYTRAVDKTWTAREDKLLYELFFIKRLHISVLCNNLSRSQREIYDRAKELKYVRSFKRAPSKHINHKFKLDYDKAEEIRSLASQLSLKEIAYRFKVSKTTVNRVIKNEIWVKT